jgi:1-acyl-sn-glycerol-3-phosphate acyltransferase
VPGHPTRASRLGWGYRVAVVIFWPLLMLFTKRDWRGFDQLDDVDGGIIIATNHTSWFDPLAVAHPLWAHDRPPRFLGKEEVFRVPIMGPVITSAGQIKVYRESAEAIGAFRDAVQAAKNGECVVVYPEGTITKDPDLWPMAAKTGAVRIALASGRPLYPMVQWGPQAVMRPYKKELRLFPRKTMQVWLGEPIDLSEFAGKEWTPELLHQATDLLIARMTEIEARMRGQIPPSKPYIPVSDQPVPDESDEK